MNIQNRVVWKITHKFIFISFISSIAIFINPQESSALTFKRVLNRVGHHLIDELLSDEPSSQDREYDRENINQQTTDNYNTYPTNDQTYNSGNSTLGNPPASTPNYQNPTNYQNPAPNYQQSTPNYQNSAPNYQQSIPNYQNSPPNYQQSTPNYQNSPPNYQQSIPNYQSPAPSYQQSIPNYQNSASTYQYFPPSNQYPPPNYQYPVTNYQQSAPSYNYPTSTSSPNFFPYPRLQQKPLMSPPVIINNF